ncbi:U7 snRNA-associated Sm-like protein LSm11 [Elysia marginata]|uniref:U7 snRNA-associated Sm-like protein LSm11 n=1 Tax=Elysia marginata TaxID=1093978 RepID=A0AAV4G576_9GAST|nr:U7 snRNA-associated Sm-like protein LSm11 [Elysia marginata]
MATPSGEAASASSTSSSSPKENTKTSLFDADSAQDIQSTDAAEDFIVLDSLNEEEIDFCSPHFNPSVALKTENITVPSPNTPSFKSLSGYEDAVKRRKELRNSKDKTAKSSERSDRGSKSRSRQSDKDFKPKELRRGHEKEENSSRSRLTNLKPSSSRSSDRHKSLSGNEKHRSNSTNASSVSRSKEGRRESRTQESLKEITRKDNLTEKIEDKRLPRHALQEEDKDDISASPKQRHCREMKNVFTRMEAMSGPLSLLSRCVKNKEHVRVVTRGAVTLSSICRGYIVAFDKYCNMAMIDVDEIYRRPSALGKVRSRISHKLLDAQKTLTQESKECQRQWRAKQKQTEAATTDSSTKQSAVINKALSSNQEISNPVSETSDSHLSADQSVPGSKLNLKLLKSVYSSVSVPRSRHLVSPRQCTSPYSPSSDRCFAGYKWELLEHPRYSPDLAPCDFHLFPKMKENLRGQRFETEEDILRATKVAIKNLDKCSYITAFKDWLQRIEKCANNGGCYVE